MTDYAKLRQLAEGATPGPWRPLICGGNGSGPMPAHDRHGDGVIDSTGNAVFEDESGIFTDTDAEFIAAANPTVVLALLDELRDTQGMLDALIKHHHEVAEAYNDAAEEIAALRRGQGRAPAPAPAKAGPVAVPLHETHPIPDSTRRTP